MKSTRNKGSRARACSSRTVSSQTSLSQYFSVLRSPVHPLPVSLTPSTVVSKPQIDNNSIKSQLTTSTQQLSMKQFILVSTPPCRSTLLPTPSAPQKVKVAIAPCESVQPRQLVYLGLDEIATQQSINPPPWFTQQKITSFFRHAPTVKATPLPVAPAVPTVPLVTPVAGFRRSRRSLI
jgi:hypothetical protein